MALTWHGKTCVIPRITSFEVHNGFDKIDLSLRHLAFSDFSYTGFDYRGEASNQNNTSLPSHMAKKKKKKYVQYSVIFGYLLQIIVQYNIWTQIKLAL